MSSFTTAIPAVSAPAAPAPAIPAIPAPAVPAPAAPAPTTPIHHHYFEYLLVEKKEYSARLTRDQRRDILLLREIGYTYEQIVNQLHITFGQVEYTCQKHKATPQKPHGRKSSLSDQEMDQIETFIVKSKENRRMPYKQLVQVLKLGVSEDILARALKKRGYSRYVALRKPPISEKNRQIRLAWAHEHLNWTLEQWYTILWTDETWVCSGRHTKTYVTRREGEAYDPTCIVDKLPKKKGWMFWGSFAGNQKGPAVFWEKDWKTIKGESYCQRIVPLLDEYLHLNPHLILIQDGAPGHRAKLTKKELQSRGIEPIFWPPYSPDLNPIETLWDEMKDWIDLHYPNSEKFTYDQLRQAVLEAWDAIGSERLHHLLTKMQDRCWAVIEAEGMHIKY